MDPHTDRATTILSDEDLETPDAIYHAVRFVVDMCASDPAVVCALGSVLCDYLRRAPLDLRGQVADRVIELIRDDMRRSLQ
jgi:hypothetical protein